MATSISNHFSITAIASGASVNGWLISSGGNLIQNYNAQNGKCVPDWASSSADRPVVYLAVMKGASYLNASTLSAYGLAWMYNQTEISFDSGGSSTIKDADGNALFKSGTMTATLGGKSVVVPCLTITGNLASADNLDLDTIGVSGYVEASGQKLTYAAQVDVRISPLATNGYTPSLTADKYVLTESGEDVKITAKLYGADGDSISGFTVKMYNAATGSAIGTSNPLTINEAAIDDYITVLCEYYVDGAKVASATVSIDDQYDSDFMVISLDGSNGDGSGQLSEGESVTVTAWMAYDNTPTLVSAKYSNFAVRLYDADEALVTSGYAQPSVSGNKMTMTLDYDFVSSTCGGKVTGYVTAS